MSELQRSTLKQDVPTRAQIAERAYQIYQQRGSAPGRDVEDWLAAERELRSKNAPTTPVSASPTGLSEKLRASIANSRQKQSRSKTPSSSSSSSSFENTDRNPVDHHDSTTRF
jgi:hypothetical protein